MSLVARLRCREYDLDIWSFVRPRCELRHGKGAVPCGHVVMYGKGGDLISSCPSSSRNQTIFEPIDLTGILGNQSWIDQFKLHQTHQSSDHIEGLDCSVCSSSWCWLIFKRGGANLNLPVRRFTCTNADFQCCFHPQSYRYPRSGDVDLKPHARSICG